MCVKFDFCLCQFFGYDVVVDYCEFVVYIVIVGVELDWLVCCDFDYVCVILFCECCGDVEYSCVCLFVIEVYYQGGIGYCCFFCIVVVVSMLVVILCGCGGVGQDWKLCRVCSLCSF